MYFYWGKTYKKYTNLKRTAQYSFTYVYNCVNNIQIKVRNISSTSICFPVSFVVNTPQMESVSDFISVSFVYSWTSSFVYMESYSKYHQCIFEKVSDKFKPCLIDTLKRNQKYLKSRSNIISYIFTRGVNPLKIQAKPRLFSYFHSLLDILASAKTFKKENTRKQGTWISLYVDNLIG